VSYRVIRNAIKAFYYFIYSRRAYKFAIRPFMQLSDLKQLKAFCSSQTFFEQNLPIKLDVEKSFGRKLLVLAPHADDETVGMGGTIIRALSSGADVKVVYVTDGGYGGPHRYAVNRDRRRLEAELVTRKLGYAYECLDAPDGDFPVTEALIEKLGRAVHDFGPDALFLPWLLEATAPHRNVNALLASVYRARPFHASVYAYQVWSNVPANTFVDITDVMEAKLAAVLEWKSQQDLFDYAHYVRGMNAYCSYLQAGRGFVEPFFNVPLRDYMELVDHFFSGRS